MPMTVVGRTLPLLALALAVGCAGGGPVSPSRLLTPHPATTTRSSLRLGPCRPPGTRLPASSGLPLIGWTVGIAIMGLVMGLIADEAGTQPRTIGRNSPDASSDRVAHLMRTWPPWPSCSRWLLGVRGFGRSAVEVGGVGGAGRPVLAGPIGRVRWAAGYVLVAVGGSAVILVVAGLLTGLGTAVSLNDISEVLPVTGAFLAQLPAVFVLIGVTVALMGWVPRWSAIAWAALAFVVIVGLLGDLLQIRIGCAASRRSTTFLCFPPSRCSGCRSWC